MGYHVIYGTESGELKTDYAETEEELLEFPLTKECIIYNGLHEWKPRRLGDSRDLEILTEDWFKAGRKAEKLFYTQANEKYILEKLSQDLLSFESYRSADGHWLKRGDFLLRDVYNLEIEVKCLTIENECFLLKCTHHFNHKNMQDKSNIPVVFAIYERENDNVASPELRMISNYRIEELRQEKKLKYQTIDGKKFYRIPVSETKPGFELIEHFREVISVRIE